MTASIKAYSTASNARRAAKQAGYTLDQVEILEIKGAYCFQVIPVEKPVAPIGSEVEGNVHNYRCPHCDCDLDNGVGQHLQGIGIDEVAKHDTYFYACLACGGEFGPAIPKKAPKKKATKSVAKANASTIERPCKRVWIIADDMLAANPEVKRKDVMAACIAAGIAFYTARTQYQQWLGVRKEMAAREAAQAKKYKA